jgi:hypothetical protein
MPGELIDIGNGGVRMYWNFTTTRFTPSTVMFTVKKVGKFWELIPHENCPEFVPLHRTRQGAIEHYRVAYIPLTQLRRI